MCEKVLEQHVQALVDVGGVRAVQVGEELGERVEQRLVPAVQRPLDVEEEHVDEARLEQLRVEHVHQRAQLLQDVRQIGATRLLLLGEHQEVVVLEAVLGLDRQVLKDLAQVDVARIVAATATAIRGGTRVQLCYASCCLSHSQHFVQS